MGAMNLAAGQVDPGVDRLEHFRALMAQLDAAGDPARAVAANLYVSPAQSVSSRIAARLALSPASSHLLVGGVGSGKTTEMLEVRRRLGQLADTRAFYVDVSKDHDIGKKMAPGVIAVLVGLALGAELPLPVEKGAEKEPWAVERLRELAHGYFMEPDYDAGDPAIHVPGLLVSPEQFAESVRDAMDQVKKILVILRTSWRHVVILIDGLDRLTDMQAFEQIIEHDVRALGAAGVGVVLVGPLKSLYGIERTIAQRFDDQHYQPWMDPTSDTEIGSFLADVLRRRLPEDALDMEGLVQLVLSSGGVLRDLIALAQIACVETYTGDPDVIGLAQVDAAIESFGRKHMQGLRSEEIEVLQRVRKSGVFVQTSEDDLALLMTRRVLEYRNNGRPRYVVHPTIEKFLNDIAGEQA